MARLDDCLSCFDLTLVLPQGTARVRFRTKRQAKAWAESLPPSLWPEEGLTINR